jgi:RHS repeat-associated protein
VYFSYDALGRVNARTHTDENKGVYVERHGRHVDGSRAWLELNLPDNNFGTERVDYAYDSAGQLRWMWFSDGSNTEELFNATNVDPWGRLRRAWFGKKLEYTANHADVGRRLPHDMKLSSGTDARYVAFSSYDALGRELSRNEDSSTFAGTQDVAYDALGRLRTWNRTQGGATASAWSFAYDPIGNVTSLDDQMGAADATLSYLAPDRDRICRIGYGNGGLGGTACNVGYDAFGNIEEHPTRTGYNKIGYFNSGNVRRIENDAGTQATFQYDPFGRVQTLDIRSSSAQIRSDRHYGAFVTERYRVTPANKVSYLSRQFPGPGLTISRRGAKGPWVFQFAEMRGTRFTTDQDGRFVQDLDYAPYGETRSNGATPSDDEFSTQQWNEGEALEEFGLVHLGARLYDPVIGRFLSRDPLLIPRTAATTNPYAFAFNDPVNFSDPSGLDPANACPPDMCQLWASGNPGTDWTHLQTAVALGALAADIASSLGITMPNPFSSKEQVKYFSAGFDARFTAHQQGYLNQLLANDALTGYVEGGGEAVYNMGADLYWMAENPGETLDALDYALSHPLEAGEAIVGEMWGDVEAVFSDDARAAGGASVRLAANLAPGGAIKTLAQLRKIRFAKLMSKFKKGDNTLDLVAGGPESGRLRFSQTTAGAAFSAEGTFAGETIGSLAAKLQTGATSPADVPVRFVSIGGNNLIVNTRSSLALTRARIPQSSWTLIDATATDAAHIEARLLRNGLTAEGTDVLRITGVGSTASSLR